MFIANSKPNKAGTDAMRMTCNHSGCKLGFTGKNKTDVFLQSKAAGWLIGKTNQHLCPDHRSLYHLVGGIAELRPAKTEKTVTKSKVAQTKAEKVTKGNKATKAVKPVAKSAPKGDKAQPVAFKGQSIGKIAKSAKK